MKKIDKEYKVATKLQKNIISGLKKAKFLEIRFSDSMDCLTQNPYIIATYGNEPQLSQYKKAISKVYNNNCI